jgi:uncharacterized membrane protein (UPF0127 family)
MPRLILLVAALALAGSARAQLPEIALTINGQQLTAEVAYTEESRTQGLMYRRILPENRGMLFVFPRAAPLSFWMMNTYIPLSIAYLDDRGVILNITDMKPLTTNTHPSAGPARYALEMNQGWFARRGIKPGAKVEGMERAPPAH